MYEAPDRYKRLISARLPGGESAGLAAAEAESDSSPLRDKQLISRAHLAPFFAAANFVAAAIMAVDLWGSAPPTWLLGWGIAVALGELRSNADRAQPVRHRRWALGPQGPDVDHGRRGRFARNRLAQPSTLSLSIDGPGHSGHCGIGHGRARRGRSWPGRDPALRKRLDDCFHSRCRWSAPDRSRHGSVPAHAVNRIHSWSIDLRCPDGRSLGFPPAQDQCRRRQPEREREPAAPGI